MKRSEAIDQLREMDAKYSCYVYCKNELAVAVSYTHLTLPTTERV